MITIDINCDVGEGVNNEAQLMPYISSCNIACGGHAGNVETMDRVIRLAQQHDVKIGAHPSFPDRVNFGRKAMDLSMESLSQSLIGQIQLFQERLNGNGEGSLHHLKAHGALYNLSIKHRDIAEVIVHVAKQTAPNATLYVPFNSVIEQVAKDQHMKILYEVFADRNYNDDLSLVSRSQKSAVIADKQEVVDHLLRMIVDQQVQTISNQLVSIKAQTCCVHGDNEAAVEIVQYIHQSLTEKEIEIG